MKKKMSVFSWCLYDFATTVFMMNVVSLCFVQWLEQNFGRGDDRYSIISALVYILSLVLYPLMGEICDRGWKMVPLGIFTIVSIGATAYIGHCNTIATASLLFVLAYLTYQLALTFYNALIDDISEPANFGVVSGLGVAARYLGTIFGLLVIDYFIKGGKQALLPDLLMPLLLQPAQPGQTLYANGFLPTAVIYLIFALPMFFIVTPKKRGTRHKEHGVFGTIAHNLREAAKSKNLLLLLLTILLGGAPVYGAIHFMSVIVLKIGEVSDAMVIPVLLLSTAFSVVGGLGLGYLLRPVGNKIIFFAVLFIWAGIFLFGSMVRGATMMWVLGAVAGIGMGGFWAISRILVLDLTPPGREGEYMALFGIIEVLCGIVGTLVWKLGLMAAGWMSFSFAPQRVSIFLLSIIGFAAMWTYWYVTFPKNR